MGSAEFAEIGVKVDGEYRQLNGNILQIENELYAPIRPKRVAKSGEKPSEALQRRGVEYIEVRALDINPFVDTGISVEQVYFLDIFLTYCALLPNAGVDAASQKVYEANMDEVVLRGRDPALLLQDGEQKKSLPQWGNEIFEDLTKIATLLDKANNSNKYQQSITEELAKINNADLTPSARLIELVVKQGQSLTKTALASAGKYRQAHLESDYQFYDESDLLASVAQSHQEQASIEADDELSYDEFLTQYFAS